MICPTCNRDIPTRETKFGDRVYRRHKMARAWDKAGRVTHETSLDLRAPYNPNAPYTYQMDCPMSGQPIESENEENHEYL